MGLKNEPSSEPLHISEKIGARCRDPERTADARIPDGWVNASDHVPWSRRGHLLSSQVMSPEWTTLRPPPTRVGRSEGPGLDPHPFGCCIRICSAMVGVPHRPLQPLVPTPPPGSLPVKGREQGGVCVAPILTAVPTRVRNLIGKVTQF